MSIGNIFTFVVASLASVVLVAGVIFICHLLLSFFRFAKPIPKSSMDPAIHKPQMSGDDADIRAGTEAR